jgi:predicted enzyme related to lactoylglutathione lyase
MTAQNPFIWHELVTPDQKSSGTFFSQLFGWTRKEVDAGPFGPTRCSRLMERMLRE